ncbi:response regulator [Cohaesibacter sp. CAU 1516]|nr:response regulator [Cohaesibacter sp. CAU 1516]
MSPFCVVSSYASFWKGGELMRYESQLLDAVESCPVPNDDQGWHGQSLAQKEQLSVLIVEDDDFDFHIIKRFMLEAKGYSAKIDRASSLAKAKLAATHRRYDVVLIDFCLGDDTGVLAMSAFGGRQSDCVMILITGMLAPDIQKISLKAGAVSCIDKEQLNSKMLEATITTALHNHRLEQELHRAIFDLEEATRAKNAFYANMSHDLKTPLNAIMGYAEIISSNCLNLPVPDQYRDYANLIRSGGLHLLEVINNLVLSASDKINSVGGPFEQANLNLLVDKALELVLILAQNKSINVDLSPSNEAIPVYCQPSLITQAIVNILSNAIKYTPDGGHIAVRVHSCGETHCVSIEDSGIGMSQDDIKIAKAPFGRCKLPPELSQEGTGLGLSIVDRIAVSHQGGVLIESQPGVGTKVTLKLPAIQ